MMEQAVTVDPMLADFRNVATTVALAPSARQHPMMPQNRISDWVGNHKQDLASPSTKPGVHCVTGIVHVVTSSMPCL